MTKSANLLDYFIRIVSQQTSEDDSSPISVEEPDDGKEYLIRDIFRDQLDTILHSPHYSEQQKKTAMSIAMCKTKELGYNASWCPQCRVLRLHYRSCNNRNCPSCQYPMQQKWVMERKNEVIPDVPYYHIVLTIPHELNPIIQANPKLLLNDLFSCSSASVIEMCKDEHRLGAVPGIISVLHTWTQELLPHYHIHMIVSGGGLNPMGQFVSLKDVRGRRKKQKPGQKDDYFLPMPALTKLFRGKMMAALKQHWRDGRLVFPEKQQFLSQSDQWNYFCQKLYEADWVGKLKSTFNGKGNAIEYLARYTFKTAISNGRIKTYDGQNVTFDTTDRSTGKKESKTVTASEFVRRFLCHILPKGFPRVRYSGFLSNGWKTKNLSKIHRLLHLVAYAPLNLNKQGMRKLIELLAGKDVGKCPACGCELSYWSRASPLT